MTPIDSLLDLLSRRTGPAARVREWRVFWVSRESSRAGVKDRVRAGVHAPLTVGRSFALDYLIQWDDARISSGIAERVALAEPARLLEQAAEAAYEDPDGANFQGPVDAPETVLFSDESAREARSGGPGLFGPLIEAAASRADEWSFRTWSGSVSAIASEAGVATSRGLSLSSESTQVGYSFWYEGLTGDSHSSRTPIPAEEASARLERACGYVERLGSPEPDFAPGTMPVLLHPGVVDDLLSHFVMSNLHGERIYHRRGAFRIEQFRSAERVLSPALSIRLEPCAPMDPGSFRFTAEGVPARPLDYVSEGRLANPILDLKYARRLGREPVPGPASSDSLRLTGPEPAPSEDALRSVARGALVLSLLGLHTQDTTRGDFSVSAPQTIAIRAGSLGGAVKAVLTGNMFDVLRDAALTFVSFEGFRTPGLLFPGSVGVDSGG